MAQRMSNLFLRTLREDPADAELPGHKLLDQACGQGKPWLAMPALDDL